MSEHRRLPKIDALAGTAALTAFPESIRVRAARIAVDTWRSQIDAGQPCAFDVADVVDIAAALLMARTRPVINGTGVILHTGLGRARLADSVAARVGEAARLAIDLEFDLKSGKRGDRQQHVANLLADLTGAEHAHVVNNAAGALLLVLAAVANRKRVLLSRGQMVEIGGSFRLPEIVRASGARLVEVGTTNRTRIDDYEREASTSGVILRCHPSNFKQIGFVSEADPAELVALGRRMEMLVVEDQGNGLLVDLATLGLPHEPTLRDVIQSGVDVVVASGDKLLGGPQAGLILGRRDLIVKIAKHPLARALRIDKLSLVGLEATLEMYRDGREREIPLFEALYRPLSEVLARAERVAAIWPEAVVAPGTTELGSGSAPGTGVPTYRVGLKRDGRSANDLARELRMMETPLIGRIEQGLVWLDPRPWVDSDFELAVRMLTT